VAVVRYQNEITVYMNGVAYLRLFDSFQQFEVSDQLYLGGEGSSEGRFAGLIRDFHFVRGNPMYTNGFTPSVLAPATGTLLFVAGANESDPYADSGVYGRTPVNVVGSPVYNVSSPYGAGDPGSLEFNMSELVYSKDVFEHVYSYYRLVTLQTRQNFAGMVQLSELVLLDEEGFPVDLTGITVTNPGGSSPSGEEAFRAFDQNVNTKWLDFNIQPLVVQFPDLTLTTAWAYVTANDADERDPVRWLLEGSLDGANWTTVHYQRNSDAVITMDRQTQTQTFVFPSF
jgi:hypothetical protein